MITYLLWSNKHSMWWRPRGRGYTDKLEEAGGYTQADAVEAVVRSSHSMRVDQVTVMVAAPHGWVPPIVQGGPLVEVLEDWATNRAYRESEGLALLERPADAAPGLVNHPHVSLLAAAALLLLDHGYKVEAPLDVADEVQAEINKAVQARRPLAAPDQAKPPADTSWVQTTEGRSLDTPDEALARRDDG